MGRRGPAPKPIALRILEGETRPSKLNATEPQPREGVPTPPFRLTGDAKEIWDYHVDQVGHMRLLTLADREAFLAMVDAMAEHRELSRLCGESTPMVPGRDGNLVANPLWRLRREARRHVLLMAREFGLTPAARVQLHADDRGGDEDAAAALLS